MVIPRFVEQAIKNEPIRIYGDGRQTRCFSCVFDVIDGLTGLMDCPQAAGRVYNIGSDEEISMEALADRIIAMTVSRSQKELVSYEEAYGRSFDDMMRRVPSLERIRSQIGFQPRYDLQQTLELIIEAAKKE